MQEWPVQASVGLHMWNLLEPFPLHLQRRSPATRVPLPHSFQCEPQCRPALRPVFWLVPRLIGLFLHNQICAGGLAATPKACGWGHQSFRGAAWGCLTFARASKGALGPWEGQHSSFGVPAWARGLPQPAPTQAAPAEGGQQRAASSFPRRGRGDLCQQHLPCACRRPQGARRPCWAGRVSKLPPQQRRQDAPRSPGHTAWKGWPLPSSPRFSFS